MARPITPAQAQQNRDFLTILRRTGNARLSAREVGAKYGTMQHRRRMHPGFAARWDAALAFAQARLSKNRHENESGDVGRAGDATRRPAGGHSVGGRAAGLAFPARIQSIAALRGSLPNAAASALLYF